MNQTEPNLILSCSIQFYIYFVQFDSGLVSFSPKNYLLSFRLGLVFRMHIAFRPKYTNPPFYLADYGLTAHPIFWFFFFWIKGWWSGGFTYGLWIGILVASGFSVVPVPSNLWKNYFGLSRSTSSKVCRKPSYAVGVILC